MGDWSSEATITPKKAKRKLEMVKTKLQVSARKIKNIQKMNRRLKNKITNLQTLLKYLKNNNIISENAELALKVKLY